MILFLLICFIAVSCTKKSDVSQIEEVFFLIRGTPAEIKLWQKAIDLFEDENKDLQVRVEFVPYSEYWSKIETMMAGGSAPDVIFLESTRVPAFIKVKSLLPLDDLVKKDKKFKKSNYYPQAIDSYTYKGKLYGIPNDIAIYALYYNQNLFDQAGLTYPKKGWKWADFLEACKKLTLDKNKDGTPDTYGFNIGWTYYLWLWQAGGDFFDDPSNPRKVIFNSKETRNALTFLHSLMYKHKVAPTFAQASSFGSSAEMFMTGKVAMIIEGHWMVPQFKDIKDFKWDVASVAAAELPMSKRKANFNAGSCFSIPKMAKNKEGAWRFIKFIAGNKGQKILVSGGFSTPALRTREIRKAFLASKPPQDNSSFLDMVKYAHLPPKIPQYNEMNNMLYQELDYLWLNKKSVDEVVKNIEKELKRFIK